VVGITQTSAEGYGQIYVAPVNWLLMVVTIALTVGFGKSDNLAAAYGIAVSATMLMTSALLLIAMREIWQWGLFASSALLGYSSAWLDARPFDASVAKRYAQTHLIDFVRKGLWGETHTVAPPGPTSKWIDRVPVRRVGRSGRNSWSAHLSFVHSGKKRPSRRKTPRLNARSISTQSTERSSGPRSPLSGSTGGRLSTLVVTANVTSTSRPPAWCR
jgi:hypothetical protein